MKKGGGSNKGSQFEREICRTLSNWWTEDKDDSLFWRTHSSGARATTLHKKGKKLRGQVGDICAIDGRGKKFIQAFTVSIKRGYKSVSMQDILDKLETAKEPELSKWIKECSEQSIQADSIGWLLIVRRNRKKTLVFLPGYMKSKLTSEYKKRLEVCKPRVAIVARIGEKRIMSIYCTTLDSFLKALDRKAIRTMVINHL
jgi:hypothetical protein